MNRGQTNSRSILGLFFDSAFVIVNLIVLIALPLFNVGSFMLINALSIIQLLINTVIIVRKEERIGLCTLFVLLSFLFHQTHLLLTALGINTWMLFNTYSIFPYDITFKATSFVLRSNTLLCCGMIAGFSRENSIQTSETDDANRSKTALVGAYLCVFGLTFNLYKHILVRRISIQSGYLATFETNLNGVVLMFSSFFILGFIVWMSNTHADRRIVNFFCILIVIYEFLYMLTGNRYEPMIALICIALYYRESCIEEMRMLPAIAFTVVGYLLIIVIVSISIIRKEVNGISLSQLLEASRSINVGNRFFGEFGEAIYNVAQAVKYFPSTFSIVQLFKILYTPIHIIPGLAGVIPNINNYLYYINNFPNHYAMGGSYIGEMYFWAGSTGFFLAAILGFIMGRISNNKASFNKYNEFFRCATYLAFFSLIRGYLFNTMRVVVWFYVISHFLMKCHLPRVVIGKSK